MSVRHTEVGADRLGHSVSVSTTCLRISGLGPNISVTRRMSMRPSSSRNSRMNMISTNCHSQLST